MRRLGSSPPAELRLIARAAVRDVIAPAAAALLRAAPRAPIELTLLA